MSVKTQRPVVKGNSRVEVALPAPVQPVARWWLWPAGIAGALLAALIAYGPALHGAFVFDDIHMHFAAAHPETLPFRLWLAGSRPMVGLSYWINFQLGGSSPFGYHLLNILFHTAGALMVFLIVRKILDAAGGPDGPATLAVRRRTLVAGFCGALFLLHPVQTEGAAYISSRSEVLSVALAFAAWACFLYRPTTDIRFPSVLAVLALFGAAVASKEHVAVLPLVILLTDYYWNPGFSLRGVWRNWRLYGVFLVASAALAAFLYSYLVNEPTVGFHMKVSWYQYLFTQCRVLFIYLRLFLFPFGQTADYSVELSRTPLEHGAIFGMLALAAGIVSAFVWRKRYPVVSFGFFVALIFFLPTSSIMPIMDLAAERRLYLPLIGLLLIAAEVLVRLRVDEPRLAGVLAATVLLFGVLTWNRASVWSTPLALWSDTVEKSPDKPRAHFGLAAAEYGVGRYADAVRQYELAAAPEYLRNGEYYSNFALALRGAGRLSDAIRTGRKAAELSPSAITYTQEAGYLAENGDVQESLEFLDKAEKADASYQPLYIVRANILMQLGLARNAPEATWKPQACAAFQKAWSLNPNNLSAVKGLGMLRCGVPR